MIIPEVLDTIQHLDGVWYECGVHEGSSALGVLRYIKESSLSVRLKLFDSFEGLADITDLDINPATGRVHKNGDFALPDFEGTVTALEMLGAEVFIGKIPQVFELHKSDKIAFAHIDVDTYQATKDSMEFIYPRLVDGGKIIVDDYNIYDCYGCTRYIDECGLPFEKPGSAGAIITK